MTAEQQEDPSDPAARAAAAEQSRAELEAIYRVVGQYANVSTFEVESNQRLHEILSGFPMYPYMTIETTPLCQHPNSIR